MLKAVLADKIDQFFKPLFGRSRFRHRIAACLDILEKAFEFYVFGIGSHFFRNPPFPCVRREIGLEADISLQILDQILPFIFHGFADGKNTGHAFFQSFENQVCGGPGKREDEF